MTKIKLVTIGGGNGQSNLLDAIYTYMDMDSIEVSSVVSMSDDGRTTGKLMKKFEEDLDVHLPPPGDLRRCLFMMSESKQRDRFKQYLETVIEIDTKIEKLTIEDYFTIVGADINFLSEFDNIHMNFLKFTLPLKSSIKGHKMGNILMANIYYNLDNDYNKMLSVMHTLLQVNAKIIPVTTKKAYIRAILGNGDIIETQDRISNVGGYTSGIADLELMEDSRYAYQHKDVFKAIKEADYIVISPGDLFTSIISNFVIGGVKQAMMSSSAKIIYIGNNTNKGGETSGLTYLDFIGKIERFLGKRIDIFVCNDKKLTLSQSEVEKFKNHISVKGGDFLYLSAGEKSELERRHIRYIEADLLDRESFYKHDKKKIAKVLSDIL